jgi:hypothetical protein
MNDELSNGECLAGNVRSLLSSAPSAFSALSGGRPDSANSDLRSRSRSNTLTRNVVFPNLQTKHCGAERAPLLMT